MPTCTKLRGTKTQVCLGDLRFKIDIAERRLTLPTNPFDGVDVNYGEDFNILHSVFAMLETPLGITTFNEVGVNDVVSHIFYVRFLSDVDTTNWIIFKNNRYDIVKLTDFEERGLFLKLQCVDRGSVDKAASSA